MGANAQTSVPTFTAGEVLTAANMNISARTGVPVFADTTARDAGFGGTGEKTLAEGQLCYLESTNVVQYYDGAAWATVGPASAGALTLISSTTIGTAVSTVAVTGAFSATYDNYLIQISGGAGSATSVLGMALGATATGYYTGRIGVDPTSASDAQGTSNATNWLRVGSHNTTSLSATIFVNAPYLAENTTFWASTTSLSTTGYAGTSAGWLNNTTSYTDFTISTASGTLTGGTIKVYGFAN